MKLLDCHTHLINENIVQDYFEKKPDSYMISIKIIESLYSNGEKFYDVCGNKKIYLLWTV